MLSELTQVARGVAQTATGVAANSATTANLVATAAVLPGMHLAGMALVDTSVFIQPSVEPELGMPETGINPENLSADFRGGSHGPAIQHDEAQNASPFQMLHGEPGGEPVTGRQAPFILEQPAGGNGTGVGATNLSIETMAAREAAADTAVRNDASGAASRSATDSGSASGSEVVSQQSMSFSGISNAGVPFKGDGEKTADRSEGILVRSNGPGTYEGTVFDDLLIGSDTGGDLLVGKAGSDTYVVQNATTLIQEAPVEGADQLFVGVQAYGFTASIETVTVLTSAAYEQTAFDIDPMIDGLYSGWQVTGSEYTTQIFGGDGADWIYGGATNATFAGGLGNDVYTVDGQQFVFETASGGTDVVVASVNYVMQAGVEILIAGSNAADLQLTGNDENNLIIGNAGGNIINGLGGDDTIVSGGGDDYLIGGDGINTFVVNGAEAFLGEIADFKTGIDHLLIGVADTSMSLSFVQDQFNGVVGEVLVGNGHWMFDWDGDANFDSILTSQNNITVADITLINPDQIPVF